MQNGKCLNALQKRIRKLRSRNCVKTTKRLMCYLDKEMYNKSEKYLSHTSINYDTIQTILMKNLIWQIPVMKPMDFYPIGMKKKGDQ